ncbi:MAG: cupin fold metalloprotein, WbuC family [Deltaproteobacteria bacterium]|nr:MAG: cupin fold metalloprotein, WbuC family [Deltaproteobacteria bacterium]
MIKIDQKLLDEMNLKSRSAKRGRAHYTFHKTDDDTLQRMLNAMQPGTYLQPHKHENPDKREVFLVLSGKFLVVEFEENGDIADHLILDASSQQFAGEIAERKFHTVICLAPDSIAYEIKDGPYKPIDDKNFASWAPKEGDPGCTEYINKILKELIVQIS